jgi:hypothetical protein
VDRDGAGGVARDEYTIPDVNRRVSDLVPAPVRPTLRTG